MTLQEQAWAVVLAAGDGTRLAALTTDERGHSVPKQFCSLQGHGSLLEDAVRRAGRVTRRDRICVIVADHHRRYWQRALAGFPAENVFVQPRNRGTANGILLSTLCVLARDPQARLIFLPADHFVRDERSMSRSLRALAALPRHHPAELLLLGIEPDQADPDLGYIVPGDCLAPGTHRVARFAEKPPLDVAQALLMEGALWNSFIFAAHGRTMLELLRARLPACVEALSQVVAAPSCDTAPGRALRERYEHLPSADFSRSVIEGAENRLRVLKSPHCGWSDLGTPKRVAATLRQPIPRQVHQRRPELFSAAFLNLSLQLARWSAP
jgi:mannose-1-phosphate guanylyltransferase